MCSECKSQRRKGCPEGEIGSDKGKVPSGKTEEGNTVCEVTSLSVSKTERMRIIEGNESLRTKRIWRTLTSQTEIEGQK